MRSRGRIFNTREANSFGAAMRENENYFRPIIDAAPLLLWATGPDGRLVFFNGSWLDFTGRTLDEQLAHDWTEDIHAEDRARCTSIYTTAFARREEFQFECRLCRKDGEYRWAIAKGAPRFTASGAFAGFVGGFIDIHDLGIATDSDGAGTRRLSNIGRLAAGIAHDFNNLLSNILANAELALAEVAPRSRAIEELERIRKVAMRGSEIVRELMVYTGRDPASAKPVDLSKLVEEMLEMLRISVTKHARVTTDLAQDLPSVIAEPPELREVLMNLILNASEALGEKDGEITISTSLLNCDATELLANGVNKAGDYLKLEVADTGRGIARSLQSRVFDPFVSTKQSGRGVGLAIVRTIARKYGGNVSMTSTPGRGTRFTVLLPCWKQAENEEPARGIPAAAPSTGKTVMIVDDEDGLRLAVSQLLRRDGFRVIEAPDGSAAVELLRSHGPTIDTILLDLTLPGLSSAQVVEEAARIRPDVRIFLTSAYSRGNAAAAFTAPQVKGFVRKPYAIRDLVQLLFEEEYANSVSGNANRH